MDNTARALGENVTVNELLQGRSPAPDLNSVYGRGPRDADDDRFYAPDKVRFKVGITAAINGPRTNVNLNGYDLARVTQGSKKAGGRRRRRGRRGGRADRHRAQRVRQPLFASEGRAELLAPLGDTPPGA
jgi:hypothetical protein